MGSDLILSKVRSLRVVDNNVFGLIVSFLKGLDLDKLDNADNIVDLYPLLIENLPEGVKRPTLDEFQYVSAMYQTQRHADWLQSRIDKLKKELYKLEHDLTPDEKIDMKRKKIEDKIMRLSRELRLDLDSIKKYTTIGMNRNASKKIDINVTQTLNIQQFNEALKRGAKELKKLGEDTDIYSSDIIDVPEGSYKVKDSSYKI